MIEDCLKKEVGEILIQSMEEDITELEKVSIYHHKLHQKNIKKVSNTGTEYGGGRHNRSCRLFTVDS